MDFNRRFIPAAGFGIIVLGALLAYAPAMRGDFVWDDDAYVTGNETLHDVAGLRRIWFDPGSNVQYYPLVFTTFWVEYHLWQLEPFGYHVVNVLLHALGALLLWRVLRRLAVPGAWLSAALFALHPVHVESVAWITERKNVLSGVFYLSAMLAYFRFCSPDADTPSSRLRWRFYVCAFVLLICALLSKTVTCTLPAAILLILWWKRTRFRWQDVLPLIPMFVAGIAMGLTTAWVEHHLVGAQGTEWSLGLAAKCILAGRVVIFYICKLLWPVNLTFIYARWSIDPTQGWPYLYPLLCIATLLGLWLMRRRIGKGPLTATLFFVGTLGPALGFFPVYFMRYSFVADHFQYLASIGIITLAAALITLLTDLPAATFNPRQILGWVGSAAILIALSATTWQRCHVFRDVETLWRDTLQKNPSAWMAHNNLGQFYWHHGDTQKAAYHFAEHIRLRPDDAEAHNHLANVLAYGNRFDEAASEYLEALRLKPDLALAHYNLGVIRDRQGNHNQAIEYYSATLRLRPDHRQARINLVRLLSGVAMAHLAAGRSDQALSVATRVRHLAVPLDDAGLIHQIDDCLRRCRAHHSAQTRPATSTKP